MDKEESKDSKTCDCKDCNCGNCCCDNKWWHQKHHRFHRGHGGGSGFYFFGFIAALFYFLQHASTSSEYLWGIAKAIFWPALIVFKVFTMLHI